MNEVWKDIPGYEGSYQVSNLGNVKTLARQRVKESLLSPEILKGYARVTLSKDGKSKHFFVHRLVANAFIPTVENKTIINHKDNNPLNNRVDNLEWCTQLYNLLYGDRREKVIDKERKSVNQYDKFGNLIAQHYSIQQAARNIGRYPSPICRCCQGKQKFAYDYIWKYSEGGGA